MGWRGYEFEIGYIDIGDKNVGDKLSLTTTYLAILSPIELASTTMKPFEECDTFIKRLYIRDRRSAFYITIEWF